MSIKSLSGVVLACVDWLKKSHNRKQLLALSDRQLKDIGVSRRLLLQGISAYPWCDESVMEQTHSNAELKRAVTALKSFSDRELNDLGISRTEIVQAVRHGRTGTYSKAA